MNGKPSDSPAEARCALRIRAIIMPASANLQRFRLAGSPLILYIALIPPKRNNATGS